jgi:N-acetylneuraminic acid mutarotase
MPEPRIFAKGAEVAGKLYAVGGIQPPGRNQVPLLHKYDPKTDLWSVKACMPEKRDAYRVAAVNGRVYVIGNLSGSSRVLEYTPAADRWVVRSSMLTPRFDFGIHVSGGLVYTFGGMGNREVEIYEPAADRWIAKDPMPRNNWCQVLTDLNGKIYMIGGGFPAPDVIRAVYEYNPAADR